MAVIFGTQGSDVRDGTDLDDIIFGWAEDGDPATDLGDELRGLAGNDELWGGGGDDELKGGGGIDTLWGGRDDDRLDGGSGDDALYGGGGDDALLGKGGHDWLWGEDGNDWFSGGELSDTLKGGSGSDILWGGTANDELDGGGGSDYLYGETGDDRLSGGGGKDWFTGGDGSDSIDGGGGTDWVTYYGFGIFEPGGVVVDLTAGTGSGGRAKGDTFINVENVDGTSYDDELYGDVHANMFWGDSGNDVLDGRGGNDVLGGSYNADRFLFGGGYDTDTITDFKDDRDTIELDGASLGVTSRSEALSHAEVVSGDTVFTFDTGDVLIVENIADPTLLRDDLLIL